MDIMKSPLDAALSQRGKRPTFAPPDRGAGSRSDISAPPDYHPSVVRGTGPSSGHAKAALEAVHSTWMDIAAAAADKSVSTARLASAASVSMKRALKRCDDSAERIGQQITHWENLLAEKTRPKMSPELAVEIRAHFKRLDDVSKIRSAVEGDVRAASAVLSAPGFLSGLDERSLDIMRTTAHEAHAPEEAAQLREASAALDKVNTAGARLLADIGGRLKVWQEPSSEALAKLEKGDES